MDGAWKRFEEQLKFEEEIKRRQADMFHQAVTRDQQAIDNDILRRLMIQDETKRELDKQIFYKQTVQEMEAIQRRKKDKTSFGPEENGLLFEILDRRNTDAKLSTKQDLEYLMKERAERH
jgi:hypothetical protein